MSFANTIRAAREARGLSREQVARRVGFSANHLVALETGRTVPPGDAALVHLANVLQLDAHALVHEALAQRTFVRLDCAGVPQRELAAALLLATAGADAARLREILAAVEGVRR